MKFFFFSCLRHVIFIFYNFFITFICKKFKWPNKFFSTFFFLVFCAPSSETLIYFFFTSTVFEMFCVTDYETAQNERTTTSPCFRWNTRAWSRFVVTTYRRGAPHFEYLERETCIQWERDWFYFPLIHKFSFSLDVAQDQAQKWKSEKNFNNSNQK